MAKHVWLTRHDTGPETWDDPNGKYDSEVDVFARNAPDPHNGPKCKTCGFNFCKHCSPWKWDDNSCPMA